MHEAPGEVRDITVIGAGPVGLSTAFWAGMREATSRVVDSLPQIGGQLTALYPEKWIFDVPGHTKVLAKDLVEELRRQALEQFDVPVHLETTIESIDWEDDLVVLNTNNPHYPQLRSRAVIIAGGHGAFEPKKLPGYDMTPWEGRGAHYLVGSKSEFAGKRVLIIGGGDSACDWVINLLHTADSLALCHRREGFRAHELTVKQVMDGGRRRPGRPAHPLPGARGDRQRRHRARRGAVQDRQHQQRQPGPDAIGGEDVAHAARVLAVGVDRVAGDHPAEADPEQQRDRPAGQRGRPRPRRPASAAS